jgi:hypothetical protein
MYNAIFFICVAFWQQDIVEKSTDQKSRDTKFLLSFDITTSKDRLWEVHVFPIDGD